MEGGDERYPLLAGGVGGKPSRRERGVGVDYAEGCPANLPPDERVEAGIAVAVGVTVVDWEGEVAVESESVNPGEARCPRSDDADIPSGLREPAAVIFDGERHSVKDGRFLSKFDMFYGRDAFLSALGFVGLGYYIDSSVELK